LILTLLIFLALSGMAIALTLRAIALPRISAVARLGAIEAYGFVEDADADVPDEARNSGLDKLAGVVGRAIARRWNRFSEAEIRRELMSAGLYTTAPMTFLGYRVLAGVATPTAFFWLLSASGSAPALLICGTVVAAMTGWSGPMTVVRGRAKRRLDEVERTLPELIDLLIVTVEAGLGFNGSLQVASERVEGPLGDELRLTLQEQRMGLSTNTALMNMLARAETPSMRSFVRSVLQGENLGVSIGTIMRSLAIDMRKRRRQSAEERAQKAPIKMLFPLVFLLLPALFIVMLFPAIYSFLQTFGS
jgi:tight adherence protein C